MSITRRDFLKGSLASVAGAAVASVAGTTAFADKTGILSEEVSYKEGQYSFEIPPRRFPKAKSPKPSTLMSAL